MNSMDFYIGKAIRETVWDTGRDPSVLQWLIAAVLQANNDNVTFDEMVKMLNEINDYAPEKRTREQNLQELGF